MSSLRGCIWWLLPLTDCHRQHGFTFGDSVTIDQTLSKTPLDNGGECIDKQGQIWLSIYEDHHDLKVKSYNVPEINTSYGSIIQISMGTSLKSSNVDRQPCDRDRGGRSLCRRSDFDRFTAQPNSDPSVDDSNITLGSSEIFSQSSSVGVERRAGADCFLTFSDEEVIDIDLRETGPRACLTFKDLGEWGWLDS